VQPRSLSNCIAAGAVDIEWDDGSVQKITHYDLRSRCRCAQCQSSRLAGQSLAPAEARLVEIRPVGIYGVQLVFADGHERGIFPWTYLRSLP
jgi:DUF971 family protein